MHFETSPLRHISALSHFAPFLCLCRSIRKSYCGSLTARASATQPSNGIFASMLQSVDPLLPPHTRSGRGHLLGAGALSIQSVPQTRAREEETEERLGHSEFPTRAEVNADGNADGNVTESPGAANGAVDGAATQSFSSMEGRSGRTDQQEGCGSVGGTQAECQLPLSTHFQTGHVRPVDVLGWSGFGSSGDAPGSETGRLHLSSNTFSSAFFRREGVPLRELMQPRIRRKLPQGALVPLLTERVMWSGQVVDTQDVPMLSLLIPPLVLQPGSPTDRTLQARFCHRLCHTLVTRASIDTRANTHQSRAEALLLPYTGAALAPPATVGTPTATRAPVLWDVSQGSPRTPRRAIPKSLAYLHTQASTPRVRLAGEREALRTAELPLTTACTAKRML